MTNPSIEPTTLEDVPALQSVVDQTGLFPSEMLPEMFAASLSEGAGAFWLTCRLRGEAAGFCYAAPEEMTDGTWNMLAIAVRSAFQGQGIGGALVTAVEARLKDQGQRVLIVDASGTDAFAKTRSFYLQNGYEQEARIRDFWAADDDKVTFRKAL
ncbi:MAG: GNAT family N-acetyltransferase [Pseudomonadota bacterium]